MSTQNTLSCKHCGDEMVVVDDDGDFFMDQLEDWRDQHADCETKRFDIHGWCADFCGLAIDGELPYSGASLEEHGLYCGGSSHGAVGETPEGNRKWIDVYPVRRYLHGSVTRAEMDLTNRQRDAVGVSWTDDELPNLVLSTAAARELGVFLIRCADVAAGLDRPAARVRRDYEETV